MMFIVILAVSIIVRNALLSRRKRRLLPLLTKEASGPYFSTKCKDGIILPDVSYSNSLDKEEGKEDQKRKMYLLNPSELMNIPIIQEKNVGEDKKIIDDAHDKLSSEVSCKEDHCFIEDFNVTLIFALLWFSSTVVCQNEKG